VINVKSVYERYQAFFAGTSKGPPQVRDRSQQDREEERKAPPVGRPRHVALRVLLTILLLIGAYVVPGLIWVGPSGGGSQGSNAGSGVGTWLLLAEYAWLARKVSYRWFDCLFAMIPVLRNLLDAANHVADCLSAICRLDTTSGGGLQLGGHCRHRRREAPGLPIPTVSNGGRP